MDAEKYEDQHVHQVYEEIAHHFSSTRYKARILHYLVEMSEGLTFVSHGR
jgi:hypothetical protein